MSWQLREREINGYPTHPRDLMVGLLAQPEKGLVKNKGKQDTNQPSHHEVSRPIQPWLTSWLTSWKPMQSRSSEKWQHNPVLAKHSPLFPASEMTSLNKEEKYCSVQDDLCHESHLRFDFQSVLCCQRDDEDECVVLKEG